MSKILIIEDDINIAQLQRDYLEAHGFQVEIETRGDKGLDKALDRTLDKTLDKALDRTMGASYDLIVLDLMLPGIDGFEVCRAIRSAKDTPILMVSAKKEDIDKIRGLGLGADDYMTKPFSPSELVARVNAHISRYRRLTGQESGKSKILEIRGLVIDPVSRRVYVNGKEVVLTTKEFDLLLYVASNPNRVFTKEELFEKVWGLDSQGNITTVTVHIRKLREKIEVDPANPQYIETIWGVGYRFET